MAWTEILLLLHFSLLLGCQVHTTTPVFSVEMWTPKHLCPGWPQTMILLISALQEARIIGVSHSTQLFLLSFFFFEE
jgi:hypothetical protein